MQLYCNVCFADCSFVGSLLGTPTTPDLPRNIGFPCGRKKSFKPRLHERCFACNVDALFWKIVKSPARGENRMCSHPRTGDATDEKIAEKNREKFNELNFLRQNHGFCQRVATLPIFAARWQRDNF